MNSNILIPAAVVLAAALTLFPGPVKKQLPDDAGSTAPAGGQPLGAASLLAPAQQQGAAPQQDPSRRDPAWREQPSVDFTAELPDNGKFTLSDHIGKDVVVLHFFATWCDPCLDELQGLQGYFEQHRQDHFLLIGIDADDPEQSVRDIVQRSGFTFPVSIDRGGALRTAFSIKALPATVFIGADGTTRVCDNAQIRDIAVMFDPLLSKSLELISAGAGITREAFAAGTIPGGGQGSRP